MQGMSRTTCRVGASLEWNVVRKMGGGEAAEGSAMYGWPGLELWSLYHGGGMEYFGVGDWDVFEEAILIVKFSVELIVKVRCLYRIVQAREPVTHTLQKCGA